MEIPYKILKQNKYDAYPLYQKLCEQHEFPCPNLEILPENCFVIYDKNDVILYMIWVYFTDSKLAWLAWPVSNKNIPFVQKEGYLDVLINYVERYLKKKNIVLLFTTSNTKPIVSSFLRNGFVEADKNITQYVKKIN